MGIRDFAFVGALIGGSGLLGGWLLGDSGRDRSAGRPAAPAAAGARPPRDFDAVLARVDAATRGADAVPSPPAPDLAVYRRLTLGLMGTIPSLEEIRRFEAWPGPGRVDRALDEILADRRCADYLAERLARAFVGVEDGPFLRFRRRRFVAWLSGAIREDRRFDEVVRALIAEDGLWTDHPATNFSTVTIDMASERPDPERLGARVARAFLGVRLDCAQCHDHPFQPWTQADFRGLAAFFGGLRADLRGLRDDASTYAPADRKAKAGAAAPTVAPRVPFLAELRPTAGAPRDQLAAWVVDPRNPRLARSTANRVWAILLGRPIVEPIDDIPAEAPPALDLIAADFSASGFGLHRLIRLIAATAAFRADSLGDEPAEGSWASFPMTRLRPEQVAGSIAQAGSIKALDARSSWLARAVDFGARNDFVRRFGDFGADEFEARGATIPQGLLLMNGDFVRDRLHPEAGNASARVAMQAADDARAVEVAYLVVLTRRPTPGEAAHFCDRLRGTAGDPRKDRLADLCWTLVNATEFSWNH